ncbi:hypothetical protein OAO87_03385 [bacterium]|nr:hypothetical protein [bacterium]
MRAGAGDRDALGRLTLPHAERAQLASPSTAVRRKRLVPFDLRFEGGRRTPRYDLWEPSACLVLDGQFTTGA